jgi:4-amino-4-deoxy-L-arabinose transferase-like glycosyltransferase
MKNVKTKLVLLGILLLGGFFRLYRVNWDDGYHFHPDERMIVMTVEKLEWVNLVTEWSVFSMPESSWNPKFFAYGSLPLYLLKLAGWIASWSDPKWAVYSSINLLGRGISAVFDLGTILLVYLLGKEVANRRVGLLGALFYSIAVLPIQLSHFYAVDTLLTFFVALSLYLLLRFFDKPRWRLAVSSGVAVGAAMATKVSGLMLAAPLMIVVAAEGVKVAWDGWHEHRLARWGEHLVKKVQFWKRDEELFSWWQIMRRYVRPAVGWVVLIGLVGVVTFVVFEPYAVIDRATWWRQIGEQSRMTKDAHTFPYTLQYVDTPEYIYQLEQMVKWGLGWSLGVMAWVGVGLSVVFVAGKIVHRRWLVHMVPDLRVGPTGLILLFLLVYFGVVGGFAVKFVRYMLPIYPLLTLMAAVGVMIVGHGLLHMLGMKEGKKWLLSGILAGGVAMMSFYWAVAFMRIYDQPNTRITTSEWMVENLIRGSDLGLEHWDDAVPVPPWRGTFREVEFPLYEPDSYGKWAKMARKLEEVEVIVIASDRLWRPLMKLKDEFPLTERYYRRLFNGELGFVKTGEFTNYPRFLGIEFNDDFADETFHVYDHPKVMVFEKRVQRAAFEYLRLIWTE